MPTPPVLRSLLDDNRERGESHVPATLDIAERNME
jgi:hypothetical protein